MQLLINLVNIHVFPAHAHFLHIINSCMFLTEDSVDFLQSLSLGLNPEQRL